MGHKLQELADLLVLGDVLVTLDDAGGFELLAHWTQGEFHHDLIARTPNAVLVIATNCNGGVKEIVELADEPDRDALWAWRCPDLGFEAAPVVPLGVARTVHWFDPAELLHPEARSELKAEHRKRQDGGGWIPL